VTKQEVIIVHTSRRHHERMTVFEDMQEISKAIKAPAMLFEITAQSPLLFLGSREKFNNFEAFHAPRFVSPLRWYRDTQPLVGNLDGVIPHKEKG